MKIKKFLIPLLFSSCLIFFGNAEITSAASNATIPYVASSVVNPDGTIGVSEYGGTFHDDSTGIEIYWEHNDSLLRVGLVSPGTGWLAIGFRPSGETLPMVGNIIIGFVSSSGELTLEDSVGPGDTTHAPDTSAGGTDDLVYSEGTESGGKTTLEFAIPMDSGDTYDEKLVPGANVEFFLAMHSSADNLVSYHSARSNSAAVYVEAGSAKVTQLTLLAPDIVLQEEEFSIAATIVDLDSNPLIGVNISFYVVTVFGDMELGSIQTNTSGVAIINTSLIKTQETIVKAEFEGSSTFVKSVDTDTIIVQSGDGEDPQVGPYGRVGGVDAPFFGDRPETYILFVGVVSVVVCTVFGTYGFVLYNVFKIAREKTMEEEIDQFLEFKDLNS